MRCLEEVGLFLNPKAQESSVGRCDFRGAHIYMKIVTNELHALGGGGVQNGREEGNPTAKARKNSAQTSEQHCQQSVQDASHH